MGRRLEGVKRTENTTYNTHIAHSNTEHNIYMRVRACVCVYVCVCNMNNFSLVNFHSDEKHEVTLGEKTALVILLRYVP